MVTSPKSLYAEDAASSDPSTQSEGLPNNEDLLLKSYDYELPPEQIAQTPSDGRDESRLMVLERSGNTKSCIFRDILNLIPRGSLLVMNDTRVMPARLRAHKASGGSIELLRVHDPSLPSDQARFLSKGARLKQPGTRLNFSQASALLVSREPDGTIILAPENDASWEKIHEEEGQLPLPPYIERPHGPSADDEQRYQTVYAREAGAVAAPTAGLHFTRTLLAKLQERQVSTAFITLHVGPGTFQPVRSEDIREHRIRPEWAQISERTANKIKETKTAGRPVIAVGTTVVRTLEGAAARSAGLLQTDSGFHPENLVVLPGHNFRIVDGMVTNFHLPKSSLLLLVAAMVGRQNLLSAYSQALSSGYRFYSYGDAMFIPPGNTFSEARE